ncbi:MAG TPA: SEC-C metal-binding domain-containing protein [Acidimicrobiales bacterium]
MAKVGRNEPCSCGSGLKAKRCCLGTGDGVAASSPRAVLSRMRFEVVGALRDVSDREEYEDLLFEVIRLPELDVSLHLALPVLETPEIGRARSAFDEGDYEDLDEILEQAVALVDTPSHRLDLAQAVLIQRDAGRIDPKVAALAVMDLNQARSTLMMAALAQAIAVANGNNATPSGLLVAAR